MNYLRIWSLLWLSLLILPGKSQTVLNNDRLRIGTGAENSVNTSGNLQQPFYYNSVYSLWRKLTYSSYPLDNAYAVDGDKTNEWNINGTIVPNPSITGQVIDLSGYVSTGAGKGYGVIKSTGQITLGSKNMQIENTYTLPSDKSYIEIKVRVTNVNAATLENVRIWVGTRDDWVGGTDSPNKKKGNLVDGEFVIIPTQATRSAALQITSGDEGVLFYTNSTKGNTITQSCCSWSNVTSQNPETAQIDVTNDGSYGFYVRLNDLAPNASDEFTWYYAAGELADLEEIIEDVAEVSGAVSDITYTTANFKATSTLDATGYWMVVPRNATAPVAAEIKAGSNYGSVTVTSSGSGAMTANVERTFAISGLTAGTAYDLYFVSEDPSPAFSDVLRVQFSSLAYTAPVVSATAAATSITGNGAVSGGTVLEDGGQSVSARGVCWSIISNPTTTDGHSSDGSGTGSFTSTITGLTHSTVYYVRAYATNSVGTSYGPQQSFTTLAQSIPTLTTTVASSVTQTTASSGGNVTADGGLTVTQRGICWNTTGNPVLTDNPITNGDGTGLFTADISGLSAGTTYYIRAFATNSLGTGYGNQVSFVTLQYPQTITFDVLADKIYGDEDFTVSASSSSGLAVTFSSSDPAVATVTNGIVHIVKAGTTQIIASQPGNTAYSAAPVVPQLLTIGKDTLLVTADDTARIYGEPNTVFTMSYSGFHFTDTLEDLDVLPQAVSATGDTTDTGVYPIIVSGGSDNNYVLTYAAGSLTIRKALLTVAAQDTSRIYGQVNPVFRLTYAGFKNQDNPDSLDVAVITTTLADSASATGTYSIVPAGAGDRNYSFAYSNGEMTVTKKEIQVVADNKTKVYGEPVPQLTVTYLGLENDDTAADIDSIPEMVTPVTDSTAKGEYEIVPSDATDNNYTFVYQNGSLTVLPKSLLITADSKNIVYGDTLPDLTWSIEGFVLNDDESVFDEPVAISTEAGDDSDAGEYTITVSGAEADSIYAITFETGVLMIDKAVLTVTADNQSRKYAQDNPELTFQYAGFVNNENDTILDQVPQVETEASKWTPTGEYEIVPGQGEDNNYTFSYVIGILTIEKADQEINFTAIPDGLRAKTSHTLVAVATSELEVSFVSTDPIVASVEANELSVNREGIVTITALQPGDNNWNAAAVSQTIATTPSFGNSEYLMTPNGDGINDYWHINYLEEYGKTSVMIYNRWGKKVFESSDYANDWDGTFDGNPLPAGSYYFIIDSENEGSLKGVINIVY